MIDKLLKQECDLEFFHTQGYTRKKCKTCGAYFWTLNPEDTLCGDRPCVEFSFINKPLSKQPFSLDAVRKGFIEYFKQHNHKEVHYPETGNRCPVIARWRSDIYLTIASIADFQPHVTSGEVPPPHNPLVISQPCIRLNDLEEVGISGRHLTMFEMMGHHAFNKNIDEIYWKEDTVKYCDDFFTTTIGIPKERINYKEQLWIGGGNAGPCIEVLAAGLEIATLVFMNLQQHLQGTITIEGTTYLQNPLNIVDTGYGLERIAWVTQGTPTVYDTVFPEIISWIENHAKTMDKASIYSLADHSKCLAFMLGDGIVPSNVKAGYLARLLIRRSLRFIDKLGLKTPLRNLVHMQLDQLHHVFPSLMADADHIVDMLDVESQRFHDTLAKGENLIKRRISEKKTLENQDLIMLYDTHGVPPTMVQNIAKSQGITVEIPDNFESMVAELHSHETTKEQTEHQYTNLPATKALYYENHYLTECDATILWCTQSHKKSKVILDKTVFYPEGGGQPGDVGIFVYQGKEIPVVQVEKENGAIIHHVQGTFHKGENVHMKINWDHRYTLMKHHTGTHLINGALRKRLGNHVWQAGSQLGYAEARFDYAHYQPVSDEEKEDIERIANEFISQQVPVEKKVMNRNDAEQEFGFRLYQGGVPPGDSIRVLHIPGVDVEACGGTHLNNTKEVEKIRILRSERIQDGVNRIVFAAGKMVDAYHEEEQALYDTLVSCIQEHYQIQNHEDISQQLQEASEVFSVPQDHLEKTLERFLNEAQPPKGKSVDSFSDACSDLFSQWKQTQKKKKQVSLDNLEQLKQQAEIIPGTNIKIITAVVETEATATATKLIAEPNYIVHIFDGKKITSAASENISIDLRSLAPQLGKLLGGSGGGKPRLTQSGGPQIENIEQKLSRAKQLTEKLVKEKG